MCFYFLLTELSANGGLFDQIRTVTMVTPPLSHSVMLFAKTFLDVVYRN